MRHFSTQGRERHFCLVTAAPARGHLRSRSTLSVRSVVSQMQQGSGELQSTPMALSKHQPFFARSTLHRALPTIFGAAQGRGGPHCLPRDALSPPPAPSSTIKLEEKGEILPRQLLTKQGAKGRRLPLEPAKTRSGVCRGTEWTFSPYRS